ncbi:hypothetical protein [Ruegeria sp. MALMAid1280]|uniref:hypothetical protein n=1 Tax=Ruegeria sp. MALMAid1280 TaxID=3411634 RepID=UPI003BA0F6FC
MEKVVKDVFGPREHLAIISGPQTGICCANPIAGSTAENQPGIAKGLVHHAIKNPGIFGFMVCGAPREGLCVSKAHQ